MINNAINQTMGNFTIQTQPMINQSEGYMIIGAFIVMLGCIFYLKMKSKKKKFHKKEPSS